MLLSLSQNQTSSQDNSIFNDHADQVAVGSRAQKCGIRHNRVDELGFSCRAASGGMRRLFVISVCSHC
jgi:hypothetical protein